PATGPGAATRLASPRRKVYALAAGLVVFLVVLALTLWRRTGEESRPKATAPNSEQKVAASVKRPILMQLQPSRQITYDPGLEDWPAWSPDGERIVYAADADGFKNLFVRSLKTDQVTRLTRTNRDEIMPVWNPANPDEIVFVRSQQDGGKLELSDV